MEEQREKSGFFGDCREPTEEAGKELGLSSKTETLDGEDANLIEVSDSGGCDVYGTDEITNDDGSLKAGDDNMGDSVSDEEQVKADVASVEDIVGSGTGEESSAAETKDNVDKTVSTDDLERTDALTDPETETAKSQVKSGIGASHEISGEEETVTSAGNEVTNEKVSCEVEDSSGACGDEDNVQTEESQQRSVDGETLFVAENKADQEKESSEEDFNKMDVDGKQEKEENVGLNEQENPGSETKDAKHSEAAQVSEEATQLSKGETNEENPGTVSEVISATEICREEDITNVNQKEENGEAMEIDCAAQVQVEKDVTVGGVLDNAGNESAGASMVQPQDVPTAEAERKDSNVVKEMEIDEQKDSADMTSDLTGPIESADSANPNGPTENAAPGQVESLDHIALFDPSSDITNFIDFSGVSSWSGNIQDLKTETGNVSLKEDKKATGIAEEVVTEECNETLKSVDATVNAQSHDNLSLSAEGLENETNETRVAFGAESLAAATDCSKEASDAILGYEENHEDKDNERVDKKTADQQDQMREEDEINHESLSVDPNQKEDTEMEENPNNFDYADDGTDSDIRTNGVKRKADVLSEDSPGEGSKTVSLAKVSFAQRPSFKIGACIARAASQMAGSPSVLKGSNFGDETLSVESFVSQLHCAAAGPVKENVVSDIAAGFFLDFRNSSALQQVTPEMVSSKRGIPSKSNVGGTEVFEFEEMGDTYWTDRVIHNGGEEQTPPTEKGNYQVVPVELKPAQVQRTRRPYRRRQSQISIPHSASEKPADFDENAPAELIMNFSETDTIPPEKSLCKMFRHFGPIRELQTEVDRENNRARVVFKKGADAEVAYNSAGRFNIFGTKAVNYELSYKITETFKVQPYVVSLGEEEAALCLSS